MAEIERMAALCMKDLDDEEMDDEDLDDDDLLVILVKNILVRAAAHQTALPAPRRCLFLLLGLSSILFSMRCFSGLIH